MGKEKFKRGDIIEAEEGRGVVIYQLRNSGFLCFAVPTDGGKDYTRHFKLPNELSDIKKVKSMNSAEDIDNDALVAKYVTMKNYKPKSLSQK